jgi:hypothetical protein
MNWQLALSEISKLAAECIAVREAGFTTEAFNFPRHEFETRLLLAFNGYPPHQAATMDLSKAPAGWRYYPNAGMKKAWERVSSCAQLIVLKQEGQL